MRVSGDGVLERSRIPVSRIRRKAILWKHHGGFRRTKEQRCRETNVCVPAARKNVCTAVEVEEDTEMADTTTLAVTAAPSPNPDVRGAGTPGGSSLEKIMSTLKQGLDELRVANLSREEIYKIEDMFMDIKKELYSAESRGRK